MEGVWGTPVPGGVWGRGVGCGVVLGGAAVFRADSVLKVPFLRHGVGEAGQTEVRPPTVGS